MNIDILEISESNIIIKISGSISTHDTSLLNSTIKTTHSKQITLELSNCNYICSLAIGLLAKLYLSLQKENRTIIITNPSQLIIETLEIFKISTIIKIL